MRFSLSCFVTILLSSWEFAFAQHHNGISISVNDSSKKVNYYIADARGSKNSEASRNQGNRFIVRLKSDPLTSSSKGSRSARVLTMNGEHDQFKSDLLQVGGRSANARAQSPVKILLEYREVFNGFAIDATPDAIEEIKKLPYVTAVVHDKEVRAYDIVSNEIIGAPRVWTELGLTGKGVRIGIIDTGVDYTHQDLGGGIGADFKIKGGYDFVNNDTDPMDDNGHGTHVAGIAAANGPGFKGVAPDASIYAYKVLGREGSGIDSWILAAIERCTDPDQNPNTDDALDVVNMSLGRSVDQSDPLSEAVNNAVSKGIIFVVAAGNNHDFGTVGTPGVAERAITVAATDRFDLTANFSSKGPTKNNYYTKPDVAAPGVDINSCFLNNSYKSMSGTSMASPHVAGGVALILEKHPGWSPDKIKALLMQSAKPSQENIFTQGSGRIDVLKALKQEFVITPGSVSLGLLDPSSPQMTYTFPVQITNLTDAHKNINLSLKNFHTAIASRLSESSFSLPAGSNKNITLTITINPSELPFKNYPDAYVGSITATDGSSTITPPVTLLNPSVTKLKFTGDLPQSTFQVGLDNSYFGHQYPTSPELDLLLPPGQYDLISIYGNRIVVNEGISGEGGSTLVIDKTRAKNVVTFKPKDENNRPISFDANTLGSVTFTGRERNFICFFPYAEDTIYVSDQSAYYFSMRLRDKILYHEEAFYDININTPQGIYNSGFYTNKSTDFVMVDIVNPGISTDDFQDLTYHSQGSIFGLINTNPLSVSNPLRLYYTKRDTNIPNFTSIKLNPQAGKNGYPWSTGNFNVADNDSIYFFDSQRIPLASSAITDGHFEYNLGESLVRLNARTYNKGSKIILHDFPALGTFNRFYGERERGTIYYKINHDNSVVKSGSFINRTADEYASANNIEYDASDEDYTITLDYADNFVKGKFGKVKAELMFDMRAADRNPPVIQFLTLEVNGKETNHMVSGQQGKIKLRISDTCPSYYGMECQDQNPGIKQLEVRIKREGAADWTSLTSTELTGELIGFKNYESQLPDGLSDGYYNLGIVATDLENNSISYELYPAFLVGIGSNEAFTRVTLIEPKNNAYGTGVNPTFKWSSISNVKHYLIQVSKTNSFDEALEYSSPKESFQLPSTLENNQFYFWRVKAVLENSSTGWSGVGDFYTGNPFQPASPVSPVNSATDQPLSVKFSWKRAKNQELYAKFELSTAPDFSSLNYLNYTADSTISVNSNIYPGTQYYWRITTTHYFNDHYYEVKSPVFTFTTFQNSVTLINPSANAYATGISPTFSWSASPGTSYYIFELSRDGFNSVLSEQSISSTSIQLPFTLADNAYYYWKVASVQGNGSTTWSEPRSFYTGDPFKPITLFQPADHAAHQPLSIDFTWKKSLANDNYKFELSTTSDFATIEQEIYLSDTLVTLKNLRPSQLFYWRIIQNRSFNGSIFTVSSPVYSFTTTAVTDENDPLSKTRFTAYPNPFDREVAIKFYAKSSGPVSLTIVDSFGKGVRKISKNVERPGETIIFWNGTNDGGARLSYGVYFVILNTGSRVEQLKVILTK